MKKEAKKPLMLIILDGFGLNRDYIGNAVSLAHKECLDGLVKNYKSVAIKASGEDVGLPKGIFGNSEVGHSNLGAGRVVYQDLQKINLSIKNKTFFKNEVFLRAFTHARKNKSRLHLMGLLSDGCVHSSIEHLEALLDLAKKEKFKEVFIHCFLDGRDTTYNAGLKYINRLEKKLKSIGLGQVATISGRFYAMDRDHHWERINKAYQAMVNGQGRLAKSSIQAINDSYKNNNFDEEFLPTIIENKKSDGRIKDNDAIIFFNYRSDRAREISQALIVKKLNAPDLKRKLPLKNIYFAGMTEYEKKLPAAVAFPPETPKNYLGKILADHHLRQLRIAETEKYAHVTYFFNGGSEKPNRGEDRILVPSPRVESYAEQPEMSAPMVTEKVIAEIKKDKYDFILLNFANADMVGHTGNIEAAKKAIQTVDDCVKKISDLVLAKEGTVLITADHGNADEMWDVKNKTIVKEHSSKPVPLIAVGKKYFNPNGRTTFSALSRAKTNGALADIAPTILKILGLKKPKEMTGKSLL